MTRDGQALPGDSVDLLDPGRLAGHPAVVAGLVLDVRPASAFAAGHLAGAMSLPLAPEAAADATALDGWLTDALPSIFLPPRHAPLLVVAETPRLALAVAASLRARGRGRVAACALAAGPPRGPGLTWVPGPASGSLWSPPPFLARWAHLLPPPAAGPVLDLACGSGRAAVWLARRGWRVTAIDHQAEALDLGRRLAAREGVRVDFRLADLRTRDALPAGAWAAAVLFRFLDRDLLARLPDVLARPAVVMLRTFRDAPGYVGNPRPRHRLGRGEAASLWSAAGARLLVHEESFDADGKPATGVVAGLVRSPRALEDAKRAT